MGIAFKFSLSKAFGTSVEIILSTVFSGGSRNIGHIISRKRSWSESTKRVRAAQVVKINVHKIHFCEYLTLEVDRGKKAGKTLWVTGLRSVLEKQDESGEFEKGFGAQSK